MTINIKISVIPIREMKDYEISEYYNHILSEERLPQTENQQKHYDKK